VVLCPKSDFLLVTSQAGLPDAFEDDEDDFVSSEELKAKVALSERKIEGLEQELEQATGEIGSLSAIIHEKDMEIAHADQTKQRLQAAAESQGQQLDEVMANVSDPLSCLVLW